MKPIVLICCLLLFCFACGSETNTTTDSGIKSIDTSPVPTTTAPAKTTTPKKLAEDTKSPVEAAPINYTTLADAYCKCAENTVSINEKLKKLMDANDTSAFEAMLPAADKAFKEAMECCRNAKFQQSTGKVDQKKLFKPLKEMCPNLPQQLMLKMVTEIK